MNYSISQLDAVIFPGTNNAASPFWFILGLIVTFILCLALIRFLIIRYHQKIWNLLKTPKSLIIVLLVSCIIIGLSITLKINLDNKKDGFVFHKKDDGTYQVSSYTGDNYHVQIPSVFKGKLVTEIAPGAFRECYHVKSIVVPTTITEIGWAAFKDCVSIESITLPYIEHGALTYIFNGQGISDEKFIPHTLKKVILLDSCSYIGPDAFENCPNITEIYIPKSVKVIESFDYLQSAPFYGCSKKLTIHCEVSEKPQHWSDYWNCRGENDEIFVYWESDKY